MKGDQSQAWKAENLFHYWQWHWYMWCWIWAGADAPRFLTSDHFVRVDNQYSHSSVIIWRKCPIGWFFTPLSALRLHKIIHLPFALLTEREDCFQDSDWSDISTEAFSLAKIINSLFATWKIFTPNRDLWLEFNVGIIRAIKVLNLELMWLLIIMLMLIVRCIH